MTKNSFSPHAPYKSLEEVWFVEWLKELQNFGVILNFYFLTEPRMSGCKVCRKMIQDIKAIRDIGKITLFSFKLPSAKKPSFFPNFSKEKEAHKRDFIGYWKYDLAELPKK